MNSSNHTLRGILAPVTTPFVDDAVQYDHLRQNIQRYAATPLAGYFVLGSNGEGKCLSEPEKRQVLETVLKAKGEHQIVMAGAGAESTAQTVAACQQVAELGADYASVLTPSYFKKRLTDEGMIRYYLDVADASPIPIFIYHAPGFTGMTLSPRVLESVSQHPNLAGIKDTSPDSYVHYLEVCRPGFRVLAGSINSLLPAMLLGAGGGVVSLADAFPADCCKLYQLITEGNLEQARALHNRLIRLGRSVSGSFGVAGVKYAMDLTGFFGGLPRKPLMSLTDAEQEKVRFAIEVYQASTVNA